MTKRLPSSLVAAVLFALAAAVPSVVQAQRSARDSVIAVVNEFFRTMTANDSAGAARTMHPQAQMFSFQPRGDSTVLARRTGGSYLASIPANKRRLVERMFDPTVLMRGPIAVVWTQYDFHIDGTFSHCGVDAFTLAQESSVWKIVGIVYTVERTGCKQRQ